MLTNPADGRINNTKIKYFLPCPPCAEVILALHGVSCERHEYHCCDEQRLENQVHIIECHCCPHRQCFTKSLERERESYRVTHRLPSISKCQHVYTKWRFVQEERERGRIGCVKQTNTDILLVDDSTHYYPLAHSPYNQARYLPCTPYTNVDWNTGHGAI